MTVRSSFRDTPVVQGFRAAGVHCGIKARPTRDLALVVSDVPCAVAGVLTRSSVVGAPVELTRERLRSGRGRGLVVNSGISNVAMGAAGMRDARTMASQAARATTCRPSEFYVASTGVIGEPLPMPRLLQGIPKAAASLSERGFRAAAEAILTTDTFAKVAHVRARVGGKLVSLLGIAKGSGMIEPNMATMLAFVFTDAAVSPAYLRTLMRRTANETFNRLSIDGETSTSDTALCFANGLARNAPLRAGGSAGAARFESALGEVCESLVRDLARDGEGATKLIRVEVSGAANAAQADRAVRRIANSPLVKTAAFGRDPNWGRILQAVGAAQVTIRLDRAVVRLCGVTVFSGGASTGSASRRRAERKLARREIGIEVELGAGRHRAHMWTCDLSYDYVRINAEYTT